MDIKKGGKLVSIARDSINSKKIKFNIKGKKGVFVTIYAYPDKKLMGCIGFIEPIYSLSKGICIAARMAAFSDPRFVPLNLNKEFIIEISILDKPNLLEGDYLKNIKIGRDGLIIERDFKKGILLPKVAVENKFNVKKFLEQTCLKAHLDKNSWKDDNCNVYIFQTEVFYEEIPNGKVRKVL